jgi:competence protein ComEA
MGYGLALALAVLAALMIINRRPSGQAMLLPEPATPSPLRVHVTGAVALPGVYELPAGSIVLDAITAAGGALVDADQNALNLARLLRDGDQVLVPAKAQGAAGATPPVQTVSSAATSVATPRPAGPLNLNTATAADLETLPGIGPSLAQRIVDYRAQHGAFATIEAVMDVPGIGEGKFAAIKDLITV